GPVLRWVVASSPGVGVKSGASFRKRRIADLVGLPSLLPRVRRGRSIHYPSSTTVILSRRKWPTRSISKSSPRLESQSPGANGTDLQPGQECCPHDLAVP